MTRINLVLILLVLPATIVDTQSWCHRRL